MAETLAILFFAHVLADYVFQTKSMVAEKKKPWALFSHFGIVLALLLACFAQIDAPVLYALAFVHLVTDAVKTRCFGDSFTPHVTDQIVHLLTLLLTAAFFPNLWAQSPLAQFDWLPETALLIGGMIYATRAGGFAIAKLMAPFSPELTKDSLPGGGNLIGLLERGLIFALMLANMPAGIGFLVASKSILRFETIQGSKDSDGRQMAEYVIIGTLASFGWAIAVSLGTLAVLNSLLGLPLLEIIRPSS